MQRRENVTSGEVEGEKKEEEKYKIGEEGGEGRVCLLSPDPRLISGFNFSRAAMSHNQTIY